MPSFKFLPRCGWAHLLLLSCLLFFALLGTGGSAWAKPRASATAAVALRAMSPSQAASVPQQPSMLAASLQAFMPKPELMMLRGANAEDRLSLPISPRLRLDRAVLHLVATSSVSLLAPRSQLQVRLSGQIIAQIPLDPKLPQIQAQIDLPLRLLRPGYNALTFAVAQHYTNDCEDPSAPELFTQIDTAQSWIELSGHLQDIHPPLSRLADVFDPKLWGPYRLTVVAATTLDDTVLRWGAMATQAAALYLGYAPLQARFAQAGTPLSEPGNLPLRLDPQRLPQGDAALVGTRAQLQPYLDPALLQRITGPFLAILPLAGDAARYVLVASGPTAADVDTALRAVNLLNYPYPDTRDAVVKTVDLPALPDDPGPRRVYPNQAMTFAELGFRTATFSGLYGREDLQFSLPPDLFAPDNSMVHLKLRFAYGAGLREDSVLNLFLNGRFQDAIALNAREGGYFRDYDVAIPLTSFKPGANVLTFSAAMMPLITGRCLAINTENLRLTLFDDSRVEMPNAARVASLPDLDLLRRTGFPYTRKPFGADTLWAVLGSDAAQAASAWMLAAKLAQVQSLPLFDARWQIGTQHLAQSRNAVVVGTANQLPKAVADALPLRPGTVSVAPYPVAASPEGPGELGPLDRLGRWIAAKFRITAPALQPTTTWVTQNGIGLGRQGALLQAALPGQARGVVTVLTATDDALLLSRTDDIVQPAVWNRLAGDVALWQGEKIATQAAGPRFVVGESGLSTRISFVLSLHPWFWGIIISMLGLLLSALTLRLLLRFYRRRHARVQTTHDEPPPLV